jgi:hypothetical protein
MSLGWFEGSALHVMLALCRSSRHLVVADEELDGTDRVHELLGKRQRLTDQRDTRQRSVLLKRSMCLVLRANVLIARCCAAGITPAYTTY